MSVAVAAQPVAPHLQSAGPSTKTSRVTGEILTSGQHEPNHDDIIPYAQFPKEVTGRTVWTKDDFADTSIWKHRWTPEQIQELEEAYDRFAETGLPLTAVNRETFPFSKNITDFLLKLRDFIVDGPGFTLIQGLPVNEWSVPKSSAIYLAIGSVIGVPVSQNHKGHVLGHVKDLGNDPTQIDKVRIYTTTARQFFHTDNADIVGLLCLHRAKEGGESDVVSAQHVWNTLQRERPDVAEILSQPIWYFDRKGEVSEGQKPWIQKSVFYWHDGKLLSVYDPYYVKSIQRFIDAGLIPGHSEAQKEAFQVLEDTALRLSLHMVLEVGDIQFVADTHVFHSRTAYIDHLPPTPRRHLMRLWLATPESEGGWKRPFPDSAHPRRGGIQVNDQPATCPLDAE
ncbi:hypothetical protein A1Q1_03161 [Trichosporon asahii var. asahii CBS 2479]|uniref:TauD/TfdA-like domain-containing protein n=1 Tax=Trichosporon asahii var. asahii (strain ATCC 90039 / CBS 2479 / JCM 2466 / KCTC 7840 / NBRC 103889/ NCYC 2677 / UAMH 7654) TaxID=1186058 RepID=J5SWN4_TRIAS|nr:hypothetical protein A1Q1_03161 [Trichosporon asahii var. asahii CBS 2479]EJT47926.1 hypothetical protein A1Q1_03161 [Trichosporon asahii var. asahii CBS 2479]